MARFMHKTIRNFTVGRFAFTNRLMVLDDQEDVAEFKALLKAMPLTHQNAVMRLPDEEGAVTNFANSADDLGKGSTVIRGATDSEAHKKETATVDPAIEMSGGGAKVVAGPVTSDSIPGAKKQ